MVKDAADLKFYSNAPTPQPTSGSKTMSSKGGTTPTYTPGGGYYVADSPDFIPVTAPQSGAEAAQYQADAAWEELYFAAGMDIISAPDTWWPGLNAVDPRNTVTMAGAAAAAAGDFTYNPNLWPEEWAAPARDVLFADPATGENFNLWLRYDPSTASQQYLSMSGAEREEFNNLMVAAGLLSKEWKGTSEYSLDGAAAFQQALSFGNYYGLSVRDVLGKLGAAADRGSGGGARGPTVKIEIPDYESMLADSKELLKAKLNGRDPEDWEMALVADEMKRQYGKWADAKKRVGYGGSGTYEVPDPGKNTVTFLEEKYADEISRIEDVRDTRTNNALLLTAATKGFGMTGGFGG